MPDLAGFMAHNIEGYLFGDIRKLQVPDATVVGVGFPLLMTVFSGIEFIGSLLSPHSTERAFGYYWKTHLYPALPRASFGIPLYKLVRNGIAHSFLLKGNLGVLQRNTHLHLGRDTGGRFIIDAAALADDFIASYDRVVRPILSARADDNVRASMQRRLMQIEANDQNTSNRQWAVLAQAPAIQVATVVTTSAPITASVASPP
jgi:hypothetical protein